MTSIPPNIIGSLFQTQISAQQSAQKADAEKNKRLRDSRELARLTDQQTHEVENADHAENLRVHPEEEKPRDGKDTQDMWEEQEKNELLGLYTPQGTPAARPDEPEAQSGPDSHIDLSA